MLQRTACQTATSQVQGKQQSAVQGIECKFLEAWHQKLHTNTTSEDVTVCEAYIAFLESGDPGTYSRVLWESGGISRADMANKWDRKIPGEQAI